VEAFVEAGPGDVLTKLAKRAVPGSRAMAADSPAEAASAAAQLA
jgi:malonyl CoA-acyl carrier protein transacylase